MIPHTIVLEPGLIVFKVYNGYWYFGRPTVEELRQDLRMVLRKCRPDWDISDPDLKIAWHRDDKVSVLSVRQEHDAGVRGPGQMTAPRAG